MNTNHEIPSPAGNRAGDKISTTPSVTEKLDAETYAWETTCKLLDTLVFYPDHDNASIIIARAFREIFRVDQGILERVVDGVTEALADTLLAGLKANQAKSSTISGNGNVTLITLAQKAGV
jgi:hypothetical protein